MEVHASKAEGRRKERGRRFAVGPEGLAVFEYFGIVPARAPAPENFFHRIDVSMQALRNGVKVGGERCYGAHVEISVRPAVQAMPDPGDECVIYRGMAEGAGDAH